MKSKVKKLIVAIVALSMLCMLFAACDKNEEPTTEPAKEAEATKEAAEEAGKEEAGEEEAVNELEEFVTIKTVMPGDISVSMEEFLEDEFAARMKEDLNLEMEVYYSSWGDYWSKFPMMISAGEQVDFYWNPPASIFNDYKNGLCLPITEYFEQYGPALKAQIPQENIDTAYAPDGEMIYIPTANNPTSNKFQSIMVRQDILEKVGMTKLDTIEDFEKAAGLIMSDPDLAGMNILGMNPYPFMLRAFWDKPLYNIGSLLAVDLETNKVIYLPDTEEFKTFLQTTTKWAQNGWIPEETTIKAGEHKSRMTSGNYFVCGGGISDPMDLISDLRVNAPDGELIEYIFNETTVPKYKVLSCTDAIAIGSTSEYPERTMMFINWLYDSVDNFNFACYGVEGEDFTVTEENTLNLINTDSFFYPWMYTNVDTAMFRADLPGTFIESYKTWDSGAIVADIFGITFNTENVVTESAFVTDRFTEVLSPYITGFTTYDEAAIDSVIAEVKANGLDAVIADYQRQVDEYIAD